MSSDRQLLFGILALQLDFISREQLIAGIKSWTQIKSKPLAEILEESQALSPANRRLLDDLVERHIELHQQDARQSLVAVSSIRELPNRLTEVADDDLYATLQMLEETRCLSPSAATHFQGSASSRGRYQVLRFHAAGGLGQVSVARDSELNREVALKEIKPAYADDAFARGRFVLEGEITGGLEHPGIVPVYGLGTYEDGRPFYAMRFIRGETLRTAIECYHDRTRVKSQSASERTLEGRQILGRFIDVCQAVEYAHRRNVLHRDLKPDNVMLGKFGETLVVDWGLAKAMGVHPKSGALESEAPLQPTTNSSLELTQMGDRVGTLHYMSPEQAAGRLDLLGPASDIFSLGATLYQILTGQTVYQGESKEAILAKVRAVQITPPSKVLKSTPKPLEAICLRALAADPAARYSSARELADDLERYLADEPVAAYAEPLVDRAQRWARKHGRAVSGALAATLTILLALGIGTVVLSQKNRELAEKEATATAIKNFLIHDLLMLSDPTAQAESGLEVNPDLKVSDVIDQAGKTIETRLVAQPAAARELRTLIAQSKQSDSTFREVLLRASRQIESRFENQPLVEQSVRWAAGVALRSIGEFRTAIPHLERSRELSERHYGSGHRETISATQNLGLVYFDAGRVSEAIPLLESALEQFQELAGADDPFVFHIMDNLASGYSNVGRTAEALSLYEKTLRLEQQKLKPNHPYTLHTMHNLANAYMRADRFSEAIALHESTLELRIKTIGPNHPETFRSINSLSATYSKADRVADAVVIQEAALPAARQKLGPANPRTLELMTNLGANYAMLNRPAEALPLLKETFRQMEAKYGLRHAETLAALNNLAAANSALGEAEESRALYQQALGGCQQYFGSRHLQTLTAHYNLGLAQKRLQHWNEAELQFKTAYELADLFPKARRHVMRMLIASELIEIYETLKRPDEIAAWQKILVSLTLRPEQ